MTDTRLAWLPTASETVSSLGTDPWTPAVSLCLQVPEYHNVHLTAWVRLRVTWDFTSSRTRLCVVQGLDSVSALHCQLSLLYRYLPVKTLSLADFTILHPSRRTMDGKAQSSNLNGGSALRLGSRKKSWLSVLFHFLIDDAVVTGTVVILLCIMADISVGLYAMCNVRSLITNGVLWLQESVGDDILEESLTSEYCFCCPIYLSFVFTSYCVGDEPNI